MARVPIIEFQKVSKRFGTLQVLDQVDLRIYPGETTVIIGESGCGKSVTLKHTVVLLRPDHGEIFFEGQRIDHLSEKNLATVRVNFGFLFQMGALFDSMTAGQNIAFPLLENSDLPNDEITNIVNEKLRMVGLDGVQEKRPAQLSGGQRKRVALARAIALNPKVILYDEPTTGLDPVRSDVINELINKLKRELGVTSLVVTHDMASVNRIADRVVMLHEGQFRFDGPLAELRACNDPLVKRFIEGRASEQELASLGGGVAR
ncbi:MAG: putative ribonucleotide transport ATP-binding protein mkl [Phycisphaerae bacterium]|nr:putative ribonucleotide transport ATP-binding protein mkl [Phycisphaerae bacterium]